MPTLSSWAKILKNIISRLARQKIWKNYACCNCSMRRKTTSLTVQAVCRTKSPNQVSAKISGLSYFAQSERLWQCQNSRGILLILWIRLWQDDGSNKSNDLWIQFDWKTDPTTKGRVFEECFSKGPILYLVFLFILTCSLSYLSQI